VGPGAYQVHLAAKEMEVFYEVATGSIVSFVRVGTVDRHKNGSSSTRSKHKRLYYTIKCLKI
jgi:hypothetical protein